MSAFRFVAHYVFFPHQAVFLEYDKQRRVAGAAPWTPPPLNSEGAVGVAVASEAAGFAECGEGSFVVYYAFVI